MYKTTSGPINSKALIGYSAKNKQYEAALDLVTKAFKKEPRPGLPTSYASHVLTVGSVLLDLHAGESDISKLMLISALEDVVAKRVLSLAEVEHRYGVELAHEIKLITPTSDLSAYAVALATASQETKEVKLASLLEHGVALPKKSVKGAAGRTYLMEAKAVLPSVASGSVELARRVGLVVGSIAELH